MSIERVNRQGGMVWRVRWREGGRNRSRVLGRKRDAEAFDAEVRRRKRTGELATLDAGRQTLAELAEDWWRLYAAGNLAPATREVYAILWAPTSCRGSAAFDCASSRPRSCSGSAETWRRPASALRRRERPWCCCKACSSAPSSGGACRRTRPAPCATSTGARAGDQAAAPGHRRAHPSPPARARARLRRNARERARLRGPASGRSRRPLLAARPGPDARGGGG